MTNTAYIENLPSSGTESYSAIEFIIVIHLLSYPVNHTFFSGIFHTLTKKCGRLNVFYLTLVSAAVPAACPVTTAGGITRVASQASPLADKALPTAKMFLCF